MEIIEEDDLKNPEWVNIVDRLNTHLDDHWGWEFVINDNGDILEIRTEINLYQSTYTIRLLHPSNEKWKSQFEAGKRNTNNFALFISMRKDQPEECLKSVLGHLMGMSHAIQNLIKGDNNENG
jgi:hypothetical protein